MSLRVNSNIKVAYLTTSFSSVSHTFIRREVLALRNKGIEIGLFGVRPDSTNRQWDHETEFLYPLNLVKLVNAFFKLLIQDPVIFIKIFLRAIFNEELNPYQHLKLIYHFFLSLPHALSIKEQRYNHIHAHFMNVPTTIAMYCSLLTKVPFSFTCHSAGETRLKEVIGVEQKISNASFVRVISEYLLLDLKQHLKDKKPVYVIRCGIDFSGYKIEINKKLSEPIKILAVGRLVEKKGFKVIIDALSILKLKDVKFILNLIGDGPLYPELASQVEQKSLSTNVKFLFSQPLEVVEDYIRSSDLLVVPSVTSSTGEKEGLPTVIVEAMRGGLVVVSSDHSGIPELVINNQTGLLFPEFDSEKLAECILRISVEPELRNVLIEKAFNKAKELYEQNKIVDELIKLFRDHTYTWT